MILNYQVSKDMARTSVFSAKVSNIVWIGIGLIEAWKPYKDLI